MNLGVLLGFKFWTLGWENIRCIDDLCPRAPTFLDLIGGCTLLFLEKEAALALVSLKGKISCSQLAFAILTYCQFFRTTRKRLRLGIWFFDITIRDLALASKGSFSTLNPFNLSTPQVWSLNSPFLAQDYAISLRYSPFLRLYHLLVLHLKS